MSPILSRLLFVLACLIVPILWGVVVNWLFHRMETPGKTSGSRSQQTDDEPTIEYYI